MKTKISLLGYGLGILVIIVAFWRWTILYFDMSNFGIYGLSGIFIILFSYIYTFMKQIDERFEEIRQDIGAIEMDYNKILSWKNNMEK